MKNRLAFPAAFASTMLLCLVVHAEVVNTVRHSDTTLGGRWAPIDFDGDGTYDILFGESGTLCVELWGGLYCTSGLLAVSTSNSQVLATSTLEALPLHLGATVSATPLAGTWTPSVTGFETNLLVWGSTSPYGFPAYPDPFTASGPSYKLSGVGTGDGADYIGLRFLIGTNWHYGWIRFGPPPGTGAGFPDLLEFAYETTPDTAIVVSPKPNAAQAVGPALFRLRALSQGASYVPASATTNILEAPASLSKTTNITLALNSQAVSLSMDSPFILKLLENSFNTTFPAGARLFMCGEGKFGFVVEDAKAEAVLLDASSVLAIAANRSVNSGSQVLTQRLRATTASVAHTDAETFTEAVDLVYDDTALATRDGTHTRWWLNGLLLMRRSSDLTTGRIRESITLQGAGEGTVRGQDGLILSGRLTGRINSVGF